MTTRTSASGSIAGQSVWLVTAVAGPPTIAALLGVVWLAAAAVGLPAGSDGRTFTLPEATVLASSADVTRLLANGADPNAPARVRAGLVTRDERRLTPLEAATGAGRSTPVQMLVDRGAVVDRSNFPTLWCAAVERRNQDMIRFLETTVPEAARPEVNCPSVAPVW